MSPWARYELYLSYCLLVGIAPMGFDGWYRESQRLDNVDVACLERQVRYGRDLEAGE